MPLIDRVKALLLQPKPTWQVIAQEPTDAAALYRGYLLWLAAIPAVAGFIGYSLIGTSVLGVSYRVPLLAGLSQALVSYALSLVSVYLLSLLINALAPRFGGSANPLNALKVAVYGATASLVGGVFAVLPSLAVLGVVAGLYSIYLVYLGLSVLMKNPPEKSLPYTAVTIVCAVVLAIAIGALSALVLPRGALPGGSPFESARGEVSINTPEGRVTVNREAFEALGGRAAEAATSGRPEDLAAMMGSAMQAMTQSLGDAADGGAPDVDAQVEAMNAGASEALRSAAEASGSAGNSPAEASASEGLIPPIPDAPAMADAQLANSPYGIGKQKLPPPPSRKACMSKAERDAALMGSGCDCSCGGYAAKPSDRCMSACGLAYYGCWAPDPSDAELAAKITDPAVRQAISQMSAAEKAELQQSARSYEMLTRAAEWEEQQLCSE